MTKTQTTATKPAIPAAPGRCIRALNAPLVDLPLFTMAQQPIPQVKVYRDVEWDEYVARLFLDAKPIPASDYFTDDKDDALEAAAAMLRQRIERARCAI